MQETPTYESYRKSLAKHENELSRLTELAKSNPEAYSVHLRKILTKGKLILVGLVVSAFLVLVLCIVLAFVTRVFAWYLLLLGGSYLTAVMGVFFVKSEPIKGKLLQRHQAPALFELIDQAKEKTEFRGDVAVYLDGSFNASARFHRTYIFYGKSQRVLTLGIPLLLSSSEKGLLGILAHEFGHFASRDDAEGYRTFQISESLALVEERAAGNALMGPFLKLVSSFNPKLWLTSAAGSIMREYRADAAEIRTVGASEFILTCFRLAIIGRYYGSYLTPHYKMKGRWPTASGPFFVALQNELNSGVPPEVARSYIQAALAETTDLGDSHPSLVDRLKAVNLDIQAMDETTRLLWIDQARRPASPNSWQMLIQPTSPNLLAELDIKGNTFDEQPDAQDSAPSSETEQLAQQAILASNQGDTEMAARIWKQLVAAEPQSLRWRVHLSKELWETDKQAALDVMRHRSNRLVDAHTVNEHLFYMTREMGLEDQAQFYFDECKRSAEAIEQFNLQLAQLMKGYKTKPLSHLTPSEQKLIAKAKSLRQVRAIAGMEVDMSPFAPERVIYLRISVPIYLQFEPFFSRHFQRILDQLPIDDSFTTYVLRLDMVTSRKFDKSEFIIERL